jgi:transposase
VFVERLPTIAASRARRTVRLAEIQRHVGLALGGAAGARLAQRLGLPVSGPTLLRLVRRGAPSFQGSPLRVIGIDDWAWRGGHRYGAIVCDWERRRIVDLLPDRAVTTVQAWLAAHPGIEVIARDRGGAYGAAAASTCPGALQVADRWHLMENASAALLDAVRRSMRRIRIALGAATIDPSMLTSVERRQHEGHLRRTAAEATIRRLSRDSRLSQRIDHSLLIKVIDGRVDRLVERVDVGEGLMGEVMRFQIVPDDLDIIEFGRVFGQPLNGEPVCPGGERGA